MPTDTIYGIVGKAKSPAAVSRIYTIRKRAPEKPCIILIGNTKELEKFGINLNEDQEKVIKDFWPGPVSIILDCDNEELAQLHRGTKALAFRLPDDPGLRKLLEECGPLIAPSANLEGEPPAKNILEAKRYFNDGVDMYLDGGTIEGKPSKIIRLDNNGSVHIIRQ